MPTYRPLDTKVQLYVANLASTTTSEPMRGKGNFSRIEAAKGEKIMSTGRLLKETPVPCLGEDIRLHLLGLNEEVPFYLLRAGDDLFKSKHEGTLTERAQALFKRLGKTRMQQSTMGRDGAFSRARSSSMSSLSSVESVEDPNGDPNGDPNEDQTALSLPIPSRSVSLAPTESRMSRRLFRVGPATAAGQVKLPAQPKQPKRLRKPAAHEEELVPQAIGLVISLSKQSFLRSFDGKHPQQDIKIDVFFNGELTESTYVPSRWSGGDTQQAKENMTQLMTGKRVHRLIERPWVIVPPGQHAGGSLRSSNHSRAARAPPEVRWQQIGQAIRKEAEAQGFNSYGECTPSGSYLASLAAMEMPDAVKEMQKPGGPKFGVIDVVVSVGTGRKGTAATSYLMEPTRMIDERFTSKEGGFDELSNKSSPDSLSKNLKLGQTTTNTGSLRAVPAPSQPSKHRISKSEMVHSANKAITRHETSHEQDGTHVIDNSAEVSDVEMTGARGKFGYVETKSANQSAFARPVTPTPSGLTTAFPLLSMTDDIVNHDTMSPSRDDSARRGRSFTLQSEAGSDVVQSSPEDGRHQRGYMRVTRSELYNTMPPPQSPLSALSSTSRRRRSDAVLEGPAKRRQLSVSRRGVIGMMIDNISSSPLAHEVKPTNDLREGAAQSSLSKSGVMVKRVVIKDRETVLVDKALSSPVALALRREGSKVNPPKSPLYPLDESVVFGLRDMAAPIQIATPMPSSSPLRQQQNAVNPWSTSRLRSQTSSSSQTKYEPPPSAQPDQMTPKSRPPKIAQPTPSSRPRDRAPPPFISELEAAWKTPELSKDCVLSYAEEGPWMTAGSGKGGVVRHVKSARPGWFEEKEVLFGVRYLVG